jgi:SAM-dependent methyltransferase
MAITFRIGEHRFERLPGPGARLYDTLMRIRPIQSLYNQVAEELTAAVSGGRLLDAGTGPGRLLLEIHRLDPTMKLFGLDVSPSMVRVARQNLAGIDADLRVGSVAHTTYESDHFHVVTCTGSLYLWDAPRHGIEEIHRILRPGCSAYLYEPYRDCDADEFEAALRDNLRQVNWVLRLIGPSLLRKVTRTARRVEDYRRILADTSFAANWRVEQVVLGNLPMWVRMQLTKVS